MNVARGEISQTKRMLYFTFVAAKCFAWFTHTVHIFYPLFPQCIHELLFAVCVSNPFSTLDSKTQFDQELQLQFSSTFSRLKRGCLHDVFKDTFILSSLNNLGKAIKFCFSPWCWQLLDWRDRAQKYRFHGCLIELSISRSLFAVILTMMSIWWYESDRVV